jgi:hypothetical protein
LRPSITVADGRELSVRAAIEALVRRRAAGDETLRQSSAAASIPEAAIRP